MIDYEYAKYITEIIFDETASERVTELRFEALKKLRGIVACYEKEMFLPRLVEKIFCKKAEYLMKATTRSDMEEILKPSAPVYLQHHQFCNPLFFQTAPCIFFGLPE